MVALLAMTTMCGCMTGPQSLRFRKHDPNSQFEPGTDAWWAEKAHLPVGSRQKFYKGKWWPPYHRPRVEKQQAAHIAHASIYWPLPYVCADRQVVDGDADQ